MNHQHQSASMNLLKIASMLLLLLLSSCSTTNTKINLSTAVNTNNYYKVSNGELNDFYEKKILAKVVIWTDENFISSSRLNNFELSQSRKVGVYFSGMYAPSAFVGEIGKSSVFTIYVPSGDIQIELAKGSKLAKVEAVNVQGATENHFYWQNPESSLVKEDGLGRKFEASEILSWYTANQLNGIFSPKLLIDNTSQNSAEAILKIKVPHELVALTINDERVPVNQDDDFIYIKKPLIYGVNDFKFVAINRKGYEFKTSYSVTRLTKAEIKQQNEISLNQAKKQEALEKQAQLKLLNEAKARKIEEERIAREGDGSNEDKLCQRYGLKPQTNGYAECRMRLDFAKADSIKQQQQYEREQAVYQEQMAAIQKERERQRGMKQLELGLRMMGGQSPVDAVNSVGTGTPIAPRSPLPTNQTITLPNGRMINCSTFGSMTNCF